VTFFIFRVSRSDIIYLFLFPNISKVAHVLETIVNNGYNHKFKWKLLFAHALPRQLRFHVVGNDVSLGADQNVEPGDAVHMYLTNNIWVHEDDSEYVRQLLKSVVIAAMDATFREELHRGFNGLRVQYNKKVMMNDDFEYIIEFDKLYDRLVALLMDDAYYYSKGQIIERMMRVTEMLNLDSDVYMIVKHGIKPPTTEKLMKLFKSVIDRCIHPYFQFGMLRHRLNVTLYFNGRLRYMVPTFPGFMTSSNFNVRNYSRYIHHNTMTHERYYCLLNHIRDIHGGEMFVNL
jgi:hypothetical protein